MTKAVQPKKGASTGVVSLKVTLRGTRPPVWRRLLIPGTMTLAAMGWQDCHLHAFDIAGRQYGDRHAVVDVADENRLTLNSLVKSGVARFAYTYDFGDNWEHTIVIESRAPPLEPASYPTCVAGKRHCPPEDCGGPWGYEHLLAVLADPAHPERAEQSEWLGEELDPDEFAIDSANATLAARFHRK